MSGFPDRILTPDLLLRAPDADERPTLPGHARDLETLRLVELRERQQVAGFIGASGSRLWLEIDAAHRRRGRGTQVLAAWLDAALGTGGATTLADVESPAARAFSRAFGLRRDGDRWHPTDRTRERIDDLQAAEDRRYRLRVHATLLELGVPDDYGEVTGLPLTYECRWLSSIGPDLFGRQQFLAPAAAQAFEALVSAARGDGVALGPVSAFRGFERQLDIFNRKRDAGQSVAEILAVTALPGYSEHHSGRAVDLGVPGGEALTGDFFHTPAYRWLDRNAQRFGYYLSYPRDNPHGIAFEPWHWCHRTAPGATGG